MICGSIQGHQAAKVHVVKQADRKEHRHSGWYLPMDRYRRKSCTRIPHKVHISNVYLCFTFPLFLPHFTFTLLLVFLCSIYNFAFTSSMFFSFSSALYFLPLSSVPLLSNIIALLISMPIVGISQASGVCGLLAHCGYFSHDNGSVSVYARVKSHAEPLLRHVMDDKHEIARRHGTREQLSRRGTIVRASPELKHGPYARNGCPSGQ